MLKLLHRYENGWWVGSLAGRVGAFPYYCVKEAKLAAAQMEAVERGELVRMRELVTNTATVTNVSAKQQSTSARKPGDYATVVQAFRGDEKEDELTLEVGQYVKILRKYENGWWVGNLRGKIGAFPYYCVNEVQLSDEQIQRFEEQLQQYQAMVQSSPVVIDQRTSSEPTLTPKTQPASLQTQPSRTTVQTQPQPQPQTVQAARTAPSSSSSSQATSSTQVPAADSIPQWALVIKDFVARYNSDTCLCATLPRTHSLTHSFLGNRSSCHSSLARECNCSSAAKRSCVPAGGSVPSKASVESFLPRASP